MSSEMVVHAENFTSSVVDVLILMAWTLANSHYLVFVLNTSKARLRQQMNGQLSR